MKRNYLLLFSAVAALANPLAAQSRLRVDGVPVEVERVQGHALVSARALASLGGAVLFDGLRASLRLFGDTIQFASHSPFLRVGQRVEQLVSPAIRRGSTLWLPVQFFSEWLPRNYPAQLSYRDGVLSRTSSVAGPAARGPVADSTRGVAAARPADTRVVVIDPGHGGRDPGKPGPNGLLEKNVALTISGRLAGLLRSRGYEVHLTRTRDTLIALGDRPHLANTWKNGRPAAIFVSIHANSGRRGSAGFETFFLSEARTEDERRVAEMENEAVQFEQGAAQQLAPELDQILSGLRNDFYQRASHGLATEIQNSLATMHPGPNRGVKQAGFRVLIGAVMPAVLVEVGFISNSAEARLLGTAAFQQKLAFSLSEAIDRFFKQYESLFSSAPGT